ncbi:MAG TPA: MAPEG family protein [Kangiella sp.]
MKVEVDTPSNSYWIIKVYPFGVLVLAIVLNLVFGINPVQIATPSKEFIGLLAFSATVLVINHSWIMTVTELTRNRYKIFASPEEQSASGHKKFDYSAKGLLEVERCLNTHRNTTENVVHYILLVAIISIVSPGQLASWFWVLMFPVARLGYSYSYFTGRDNLRGLFMSLSLLSIYGMAAYLVLGFTFY